jgi:hypothetical protein
VGVVEVPGLNEEVMKYGHELLFLLLLVVLLPLLLLGVVSAGLSTFLC